jgi:hypothetical protein
VLFLDPLGPAHRERMLGAALVFAQVLFKAHDRSGKTTI